MDNSKGDNYFASKLREDMAFIVKHTTDISIEQLQNNEVLLDSMLFRCLRRCQKVNYNDFKKLRS